MFQNSASVIVSPSKVAGGIPQQNPFNLLVGADDKNAYGAVDIWSAAVATAPAQEPLPNPGPVLLQYWEIQWTDNTGTSFSGQLTNPHTEEAVAFNLITAPTQLAPGIESPFPQPIGSGSTLQGLFQENSVVIDIQGNTVDGSLPFATRVEAVL